MKYPVKILEIKQITWNVKRFRIEKPAGYKFIPGQASYVRINENPWKDEQRPFTFTCLNSEKFLEFTIKRYPQHGGVTDQLHKLRVGSELIISEPVGYINYKGPGIFIAGGAGITPFIAILRQLDKDKKIKESKLFFSNKTEKDIILRQELEKILGKNLILVVTEEKNSKLHGRIDEDFLGKNISKSGYFYVCGPAKMVSDLNKILLGLGIEKDKIINEKL